jgi:hypothetical protein
LPTPEIAAGVVNRLATAEYRIEQYGAFSVLQWLKTAMRHSQYTLRISGNAVEANDCL